MVIYGGRGVRGEFGGVQLEGHLQYASRHSPKRRGFHQAPMPWRAWDAPPTAPPLINLDEFSAEYSSRAFKPLANCN